MTWAPPASFTALDRVAWEALGPGYAPLAQMIRRRLEVHDHRPLIVGITGSVAVGKSCCAGALVELLRDEHVEVVSTDGFLFPNAELAARGLLARKGFPGTYDVDLASDVLRQLALGRDDVTVPRYSHRTYDIEGPPRVVGPSDVLIIEGVNALGRPIADFCSVRVYIDADEGDVRAWYVQRFRELVDGAVDDPGSFFAAWAGMGARQVEEMAAMAWEHINLVNLTEHILPMRWTADIVVRKGRDHTITAAAVRKERPTPAGASGA